MYRLSVLPFCILICELKSAITRHVHYGKNAVIDTYPWRLDVDSISPWIYISTCLGLAPPKLFFVSNWKLIFGLGRIPPLRW